MVEAEQKYQQLVARDYTEAEFRKIWHDTYCLSPITTFDGIDVKFYDSNFDHAFFESSNRRTANKDVLSLKRLSRILWIKDALTDPDAELHVGYISKSKTSEQKRRVALVKENYVVVIQLYRDNKANFITAFVGDPDTITSIKSDPDWAQKRR